METDSIHVRTFTNTMNYTVERQSLAGYFLLMVGIWLTGCSHTRTFDTDVPKKRTTVNAHADREKARVGVVGGKHFSARSLHVAPDMTTWIDPATGESRSVPTAEVVSIEFRNRLRGTIEGLGIGLVVGAGLGALLGAATYEEPPPDEWCFLACTPSDSAVLGAAFLGAGGTVLGGLIGLGRGHRIRYVTPASEGVR